MAIITQMFAQRARRRDVRVLIVDDAPCCRRVMCELLERRGYHVAGEAEGVAAALRLIESIQADAALLDIRLPDGDGFELAAQLMRSQPKMAVLMTSGDFEERFYALADASGARGFVPKSELARVELGSFWPGGP